MCIRDRPVIFIIENNGYGLSTPVNEQYRCAQLADRAKGYGMESVVIDGNNVLEVYETIKGVRDYCIKNQKQKIEEELKIGFDSKPIVVNTEDELRDVFKSSIVNRQSSMETPTNTET